MTDPALDPPTRVKARRSYHAEPMPSAVNFNVGLRFSAAEVARLSPEQAAALFVGIAGVLAVQNRAGEGPS